MSETTGGKVFWGDAASAYAQGITDGAAVERERIRHVAQEHAFTLFRPGMGSGPEHGQSMDVVPLASLLAAVPMQDQP